MTHAHSEPYTPVPVRGRLPTRAELADLFRLALPVVVVQVGLMAMGVVDSIMVGHVSPTALASVAIGNLYFFGLAVFGMGVLMALDPVVAQAVGAGDERAIARAVQRGLRARRGLEHPHLPAAAHGPALPHLDRRAGRGDSRRRAASPGS